MPSGVHKVASCPSVLGSTAYNLSKGLRSSDHLDESASFKIPRGDEIYEPFYPLPKANLKTLDAVSIDYDQLKVGEGQWKTAKDLLKEYGVVLLDNVPLHQKSDLSGLADVFGVGMDYVGGTNKRDRSSNILNVGSEPHFVNVAFHNEMSYSYVYPETFMIGCIKAPSAGGETVIGDNKKFTLDLQETLLGRKLEDNGLIYIRNFHDQNNPLQTSMVSWQEVFGTENPEEAADKARSVLAGGEEFHIDWRENGGMRISYKAPAFEYDPTTNMNLCFASIGNSGYWFRQWAPFNMVENEDRPFHMHFGDGTEFSECELEQMVRLMARHSIPVKWKPGRVAVLDNRRWTHARPPYELLPEEERVMGVALLNPTSRSGPQRPQYV